ncbi:MFS transporter [Streptomyces mexicanus]|uniref:MFS transporter n=1 Tax=Streptomyces mexicanus TaxID=178566 RepID=A0A7X1I1V1_9ACTN|nr:MFS transporter [Streptomyces mexicanus]MBC2867182.1 MFS transporter [Streptomyces mexicanus]
MRLRHTLLDVTPLRTSPAFRRLWIGQSLSGLGGQMTLVAVLAQVWQSTRSTTWTGAVGLAQAVPVIAIGLFAGSIVDRVDRRRFYLLTTVGQAACSLVLALQGFLAPLPAAGVLTLVAVQSCFVAGGGPASRAFVPHLLPGHRLAAGLTLNRIAFQGAMLAGPALGGLLAGGLGVGGCYLIDALTFAAAFHGALGLPRMKPGDEPARPGLRGVLDGLAFLVRTPVIRGALLTDLAATVPAMPVSLFPVVNAERFGGDPRTLGLFLTAVAVGGVAASVLSGTFTRLPRHGPVMLAGAAVWGAALALFGMVHDPWVSLACLAVAGAADTVSVVSRGTVVQTHTPSELLGRVGAAEQIVGRAGPDVGNLRAGLVADATSASAALVSGGLLCLGVVALVGATTTGLRRSPAPAAGTSSGT